MTGSFANFTTDVSQSNFVSSSRGFAFNIEQAVGSGDGTFDFTPDVTIPVNSYLLKSTDEETKLDCDTSVVKLANEPVILEETYSPSI